MVEAPARSPREGELIMGATGGAGSGPLTEDDVRTAALALPDTVERASYGRPGFRVHDVLFARLVEDDLLLVWRSSLEDKDALLAHDSAKFTTTPHYDNHPSVLVRLSAVDAAELAELLAESWEVRAPARVRAAGAGN